MKNKEENVDAVTNCYYKLQAIRNALKDLIWSQECRLSEQNNLLDSTLQQIRNAHTNITKKLLGVAYFKDVRKPITNMVPYNTEYTKQLPLLLQNINSFVSVKE